MPARVDSPGEIAATLIGSSAAIHELKQEVDLASRFLARVMIVGEYGVGKRRLAKLIHRRSIRCRAPFVAVKCAKLPDAHLEARLFGDSCGRTGTGAFERADGGTVFLEDLDALSLPLQARLMEFLATRDVHPDSPKVLRQRVNVRIICSTRTALVDGPVAGSFRKDLYYLLNTVYLPIPPLRERPDDVEPLLEYFTSYYARRNGVVPPQLTHDCLSSCRTYDWPGNLRQLQAAATMFVAPVRSVTRRETFESVAAALLRATPTRWQM